MARLATLATRMIVVLRALAALPVRAGPAVALGLGLIFCVALAHDATAQQSLSPELMEELEGGAVPGDSLGTNPISDKWRDVRRGVQGTVSIPDKQAGVLVQSHGENWRNFRNGPLSTYSVWGIVGMIVALAAFFLLRGRIRIDAGKSGKTITRFNDFERFGHWLLAVSFIVLALTGLNILYGRYIILPVVGPEIFGAITYAGKYLHNYLAFAFMLAIGIVFVAWIANNIPNKTDLVWLSKGGGMFTKGSHPPARKFNAGQKILFWLVIVGGGSISLSGWALMFPFEYAMFAKTFVFLNNFGFNLPTDLTPIQEMQFAQAWHTMVAVFMIAVVIAHIYIGSVGMEGAFDAMGSGEVDVNWAKEHHSLWVEEVMAEEARTDTDKPGGKMPAPAE